MLSSLELSTSQRSSLETAAAAYELQIDRPLASYLEERGIDRDAALGSRLGLCADPMPGHEQYRGRLVIPYVTAAGVMSLRFRDLTGTSSAKYLGAGGAQTRLFNARVLAESPKYVAICEGELDAIVMNYRVGIPAVGVAGRHAWREHFPRCFSDVERVFIVTDNDDKEDNAGQELAKAIHKDLPRATNILPPRGMDVTDWFLAVGRDGIREALGV